MILWLQDGSEVEAVFQVYAADDWWFGPPDNDEIDFDLSEIRAWRTAPTSISPNGDGRKNAHPESSQESTSSENGEV